MIIPNFGFGGAQKVFADHSQLLLEHANVTEYVFNDFEEKKTYESLAPYKSLNVPGGGAFFERISNFRKRINVFKKLKKEYKPDVTISHLEGADYINLLSGGRDKKIIVIHGSKQNDQNISGITGWIRHRLLMPRLYQKAYRIITVSRDIKREMINSYGLNPGKVVALPNFFDCAAIAKKAMLPINNEWLPLFETNAFKIITFARLATQKNIKAIFPVIAALKKLGLNVKLYILGDGELRSQLIDEAESIGKTWTVWNQIMPGDEQEIFFLGYQANPHAFLKHANLYVMTSLWEGFPMALCEAMASGIAVMAADCPTGPREILDNKELHNGDYGIFECGCLLPIIEVEKNNGQIIIRRWTDTIFNLFNNYVKLKEIANNGLASVQQYDRKTIGKEWLQAYLT